MRTDLARPRWSVLPRSIVDVGARIDRLITWKRARTYALPLLALYACAYGWVLWRANLPLNASGEPIGGDFIAFQSAARLVLSGHAADLYNRDALAAVQNDLLGGRIPGFYDAYRNPPFFALLYIPFAAFDLVTGFALYTLFSLGCLGLALWILLREDTFSYFRPRWRGLLVLVFAFPPVYFGLIDGENATLSLLLYALIYRSLARGEDRAAGLSAALGLFKPQLFLVFPLVCIARGRWRTLAWYGASALALGGVWLLLVGPTGMGGWLGSLLDLESGNATANRWRMASLKSFLDSLLPAHTEISLGLYLVAAALVLSAVFIVWRSREVSFALAWTFTVLAAVLVDPHLVDYDLTVLIAAAAIGLQMVPALRRWSVAAYLVLLVRLSIPLAEDLAIELAVPLLVACAWVTLRAMRPTLSQCSQPA